MTGLHLKHWAHVRNNRLMFKAMVGLYLKRGSCVRNNGHWLVWVGCVDVMLVLTRCCHQEVSEEIKRRVVYGSPLHAPGGSPTPCVSSHIFLCHPKPPFPTRTLQPCEKTAYIPCWRGEAGWLLARNVSAWGPKI